MPACSTDMHSVDTRFQLLGEPLLANIMSLVNFEYLKTFSMREGDSLTNRPGHVHSLVVSTSARGDSSQFCLWSFSYHFL